MQEEEKKIGIQLTQRNCICRRKKNTRNENETVFAKLKREFILMASRHDMEIIPFLSFFFIIIINSFTLYLFILYLYTLIMLYFTRIILFLPCILHSERTIKSI